MASARRKLRNAERNARRYLEKYAEADKARQADHDLRYADAFITRGNAISKVKNHTRSRDFIDPRQKAGQCTVNEELFTK